MIKNFIFDFGQVLVRFDPVQLTKPYTDDKEEIKKISNTVFIRDIFDRLDSGEIDDEEGRNIIIKSCDSSLLPTMLKVYDNWMNNLTEIEGMKNLVRHLKRRGNKVYLLSNISKGFEKRYKSIEHINDILKDFDGIVCSGTIKMVKPNEDIYLYLLNKYNLEAEECIFIDDKKENTDTALRLSMKAYTFDGDSAKLREYFENTIF